MRKNIMSRITFKKSSHSKLNSKFEICLQVKHWEIFE